MYELQLVEVSTAKFQKCFGSFFLTHWCPAGFGDFHTRTTGLHVAVHVRSSGAVSGRELFKGSKDVASLLVCTRKKIFGWGMRIFCE